MALLIEKKFVVIVVVLVNFVVISLQASSAASESYVAAVVEYAPVSGATLDNKDEIFMQNVHNYACFMEEAARQGADIIVFPEIGLASMGVPRNPDGTPSLAFYVPEPGANPCSDNSSEIAQGLRELSCAAKRHALYAVVNLPERVNCSGCPCPGFPATVDGEECPPSGAYFHNTNVAFDRTGKIVARYRKFNLFGEPGFVPTQEPELAIFETDFGVSFATFICFDIMFEEPAVSLARDHSVCDFAFPTAWFSEAPFLTAVQTQAAWAYSLDVNLLAAGYNKPEVGSAGSGIFLGRNGSLQAVMPGSTTSQLLVGTVPKMRRCQESPVGRRRRAAAAQDDDTVAVGRTPLSAFHHIVYQRKYGHLDSEDIDDLMDDSAPAFIHHKMYEQSDEGADSDEDSQPPTGEYESKVPLSSFMGMHKADEAEEASESDDARPPTGEYETTVPLSSFMGLPKSDEAENEEETDRTAGTIGMANEVARDIPEKKIPGSTSTDPYDEIEPSQNPDLLVLYKDDPEEQQLPEEFLEIEVPESDERPFEPERDQEYFKLPNEEEITLQDKEKEESQQLLSTDESAEAATGGASLSTSYETEEKVVDTVKEQVTNADQEITSDGERNTTQEEIEAALKKFEWLIEEQNVPCGPIAGKGDEAPREEHIDDTDDLLAEDHGLDLLEDGGQDEEHIDDTDDVLADHHGLSELDEEGLGAAEQQGAKGSETDSLTEDTQPAESEDKLKKPDKRRKTKLCRRNRHKQKKNKRKCKPRPKAQEAAKETDGMITDDTPVVETSEYGPEAVSVDIIPEGQEKECEPKRPCKQREKRESGCPAFRDGVLDDGRVTKRTEGLFLKRDHLEVYKTFALTTDSNIENSTVLLCDGTFCCNFNVVLEVKGDLNLTRYAYRLAVFNGVRTFDGVATGGLQVCGLIPCSRDDMDSCGMLTLPDEAARRTVFRSVSVSGSFSGNHTLVAANTAVPGLLPLPADLFDMTAVPLGEQVSRVTLRTTAAVQQEGTSLLAFAIYSRIFKRDGEPATTLPEAGAGAGAGDDPCCQ